MSDYLLLRNPKSCPACGFTAQHPRNGFCGGCGIRLFPCLEYDFQSFANEVAVNFWAFDKQRGWVHRDHLLVKGAKALPREYKVPKLPENYGKHTTPEQVARRGGRTVKRVKSKMP